jgi:hypothetical protein
LPKLPPPATIPKLPPSAAVPKLPPGAAIPPPIGATGKVKTPTTLLPQQLTIAEDEEITLDDLDADDLLQDIVDLDKFEINEADMIDIDANPEVFGDLDDMKSFLEGVAGEMEDVDFDDINLDF